MTSFSCFCSKHIIIFENTLATTVNKFVINKLVKLKMLLNNWALVNFYTGNPECNIIMWMDHRASKETDIINATKHDVLKYTGGAISLEMEPPKLMWLKKVAAD